MLTEQDGHDDVSTDAPSCAPELIGELLRQLDKTVRLHQLYPVSNPTYIKALDALRVAFRAVWQETGAITLQVSETQFICGGAVVLDEPEKASDSLPWTLFKDGVRQLTLRRGFEDAEIDALLAIIPKVRRAQDWEEDVLTLLWAQDFEHLSYRFVDTVSSEGVPLDPSATPGRWPAVTAAFADPREAVEAARRRAAAGGAALEGVLRTAAAPDPEAARARAEAMRHLRDGIAREYAADLRRDVADLLIDILELQRDAAVRMEAVRHLDALLLLHLSARSFGALVQLLKESAAAAARAPAMTVEVRAAVGQLGARLSDPALLVPLLEWVDGADERPAATLVADLIARLDANALGPLLQWSAQSRHYDLRQLYIAGADRLADAAPAELAKLVGAPDDAVALEAMRRCAAHRQESAVVSLVRQLGHESEPRRAAALAALAAVNTPRALGGVERALGDASSAVRTSAMRILTTAVYRPVLTRVAEWVQSRDVRDMDGNERRALFELFGTLCGDSGLVWLSAQLDGPRGFFKRKSDPETRACAAAALGRVGSLAAREVLRRAADTDEPLVRQAVRAALARGGDA
ncbi:MAG: HEAT repeat domain-containing protein [Gemmatimonadota bacterium]|nr:HEAT repeat domain-containing protein [Gemmatimonadota bacterium]